MERPNQTQALELLSNTNGQPLRLLDLQCSIEVHLSLAFVSLRGKWTNAGDPCDARLRMPMDEESLVTQCEVRIGQRVLTTIVVDIKAKELPEPEECRDYEPGVFAFPVPKLGHGDVIEAKLQYFQPMIFLDDLQGQGSYFISVPLPPSVQSGQMPYPGGMQAPNITINCTLFAAAATSEWVSKTHNLKVVYKDEYRTSLQGTACGPQATAFELLHSSPTRGITPTVLLECSGAVIPGSDKMAMGVNASTLNNNSEGHDGTVVGLPAKGGAFAMILPPPSGSEMHTPFGRRVVFLIDRSASMTGRPMEGAKQALAVGVKSLTDRDYFEIVGYNHDSFSFPMRQATSANQMEAEQWLARMEADGGTNILDPLIVAADALVKGPQNTIPIILLITDGAVSNERDICRHMSQVQAGTFAPRIFTLGIGPHCNTYFLKQLSIVGRGYTLTSLMADNVYDKMVRLMNMSTRPLLTNIQLNISKVEGLEIYPNPIPDLFKGMPLVVSGRYSGGSAPTYAEVRGLQPDGIQYCQQVQVRTSMYIPLTKVFTKDRLNFLAAMHWLNSGDQLRDEIVEESCAHSTPCAYTAFACYETTAARVEQEQRQLQRSDKAHAKRNLELALAAALGGVVIMAVAAGTAGDVAATLFNTGWDGNGELGDALGEGGDDGCCGCACDTECALDFCAAC